MRCPPENSVANTFGNSCSTSRQALVRDGVPGAGVRNVARGVRRAGCKRPCRRHRHRSPHQPQGRVDAYSREAVGRLLLGQHRLRAQPQTDIAVLGPLEWNLSFAIARAEHEGIVPYLAFLLHFFACHVPVSCGHRSIQQHTIVAINCELRENLRGIGLARVGCNVGVSAVEGSIIGAARQ